MDVLIGFEYHAQLKTKRKLYCDCSTDYLNAPPNTNVCPICLGLPGNKPMPPNKKALEYAVQIALLLGCEIVTEKPIYVLRKHYDYPDLPNGYQKTTTPIGIDGMFNGVKIKEIHIEDDPGRFDPRRGRVDFNRCGVPLVEIVTEPQIHSPSEARKFWKEMTEALMTTGLVREEPGSIRSDVNISLAGGARVEIKNINSAKGVEYALKYEIKRQKRMIQRGRKVMRETRGYLEDVMITVSLRRKETFADYRYIPDPDIPPIILKKDWVRRIYKKIERNPFYIKRRLEEKYKLSSHHINLLLKDEKAFSFFEKASEYFSTGLIMRTIEEVKKERTLWEILTFYEFQMLCRLVEKRSFYALSLIKKEWKKKPENVEKIIERVMKMRSSEEVINRVLENILISNPRIVNSLKKGERKALNYLVGRMIKELPFEDPRRIRKKLEERFGLWMEEKNTKKGSNC